jgi:hypothetical protein
VKESPKSNPIIIAIRNLLKNNEKTRKKGMNPLT